MIKITNFKDLEKIEDEKLREEVKKDFEYFLSNIGGIENYNEDEDGGYIVIEKLEELTENKLGYFDSIKTITEGAEFVNYLGVKGIEYITEFILFNNESGVMLYIPVKIANELGIEY